MMETYYVWVIKNNMPHSTFPAIIYRTTAQGIQEARSLARELKDSNSLCRVVYISTKDVNEVM